MTERIEITEEDERDLAQHVSPKLRNQILQDHEKAKNWDSIVSISNKYDIVSPLQLAMDYNEIVNRLKHELDVYEWMSDKDENEEKIRELLQNILEKK